MKNNFNNKQAKKQSLHHILEIIYNSNVLNYPLPWRGFNPFPPRSDHYVISPYIINTLSTRQVMRIKKIIN